MFLIGVFVAYWRRAGAATRSSRDWAFESARDRRRSPAATWKARKSGSASPQSALFATVTTDASCGAVNSMHDSYTPLGGLVPLFNMQTGEVIFGGVGAGLYGILLYAILAVFIAGLMVGRTPEYLGQEDRAEGSQDGDARADRNGVAAFWSSPVISSVLTFAKDSYWNSVWSGDGQPEQRGPAWTRRDPLRLHERHRATTAARSPASAPTRPGTT